MKRESTFGRINLTLQCLAVAAGLILSILSALKVCTGPCREVEAYTILGFDFGWFGTVFFGILIILILFGRRFQAAQAIIFFLALASVGAEMRLLWLQKFVIGRWCPLCIGIASAALLVAALLVNEKVFTRRGGVMKSRLVHAVLALLAIITGFTAALMGVTKDASAEGLDIYLGNLRSTTTVYYISDWFCPSCRKVEPQIEQMFPDVAKTARVAFVDMPIHKETINFTPYHLQFMLYEKSKYIELRRALDELSRKTKNPTPDQVQAVVTPLGVKIRPLDLIELQNGILLFQSLYRGLGATATPTVVVVNEETKKLKQLVGDRQISKQTVLAAIKEVQK